MLQIGTSKGKFGLMFRHTVVEAGYSPKYNEIKFDASTLCILYKKNALGRWEEVSQGTTIYNDDKDIFSFSVGRKAALAIAMHSSGLDTKTRAEFWRKYLELAKQPVAQKEAK